ncbi:CCA tRNA nucleotidyltransferase [Fructobacillus fructosus]|uniref:CCA tRNA nucleotidyltransferase n=1 Tax=Fructobacillus fructosus TaxID=1631 RepID=UPI002DAE2FAC|nr:tRNA nucleotidyltransferase/poly(A) polymerase (PcnB) [Fructobacillus fructosus]CAK1227589.1 tRNA nucleotidyltransferase/poly(A) polymerase (PcnB) [Fructobacillus fructosus]CAK1227730.1 tRNA nucleotidyltransferase/poly(A) polymerase (PcnB) [Fructobacillus fructosus]
MHFDELPSQLVAAKPILEKINQAGYEAYFVGGCVRDMILGQELHDVDIASSAYPEEIKQIFDKTVDTGIQHGTVMVLDHGEGYEITTFRTESTYTDFRRPDSVTFVRSLEEDLKRRDFTINAFALDADGQVIDLFNGLGDLEKKQIRAVGDAKERFTEDALRMMRALRFASKLDFAIEEKTLEALEALAPNLEKIAVERIQVEFEKMLMGQAAGQALLTMVEVDLLPYLPGQAEFVTNEHLLYLASHLQNRQPQSLAQVWTLYIATIVRPAVDLQKELRSWKLSREIMATVGRLAPAIQKADSLTIWDVYQINDLAETLLAALKILSFSPTLLRRIEELFFNLPIRSAKDLAVNGGQLIKAGLATPGPLLGKQLSAIELAVVEGRLENEQEAIFDFVKEQ